MRFLLSFLALVLVASAAPSNYLQQDAKSLFEEFKVNHQKNYASHEEEQYRLSVFINTLANIDKSNQEHPETTYGITKFADLTVDEFRNYVKKGGYQPLPKETRETMSVYPDVPKANLTSWDWRDHGAVTYIRDQGQCGSCWAFSVTEAFESAWAIAGNPLVALSPQQIVDCDVWNGDSGCNGGDPTVAYKYLINHGLESDDDYPYDADQNGCNYDSTKVVAHMTNWTYAIPPCFFDCTHQEESALIDKIATVAPASICISVDDDWQNYVTGIYNNTACPKAYSSLNHCIQLVGYNTDSASGQMYWIVRNSWGGSWGQNGYIYMAYGNNLCGIADEVTFVEIKK